MFECLRDKTEETDEVGKTGIVENHCKQFICHNTEWALQAKLVE